MKQAPFVSQNDAKYRNARISLLTIIIMSGINLFSLFLMERYFVFSAYVPRIMSFLGFNLYADTQNVLFPIFCAIAGLISIVPYLVCWIFSKNHRVGWMIAALVLFSLDSLIFLPDFLLSSLSGDLSMLLDLFIRVWALVTLIQGVVSGFRVKKELAEAAQAAEFAGAEANEGDYFVADNAEFETAKRSMTITRKKSFACCAVPMVCYVNGEQVCVLKNGATATFEVPTASFELSTVINNGLVVGKIDIPYGDTSIAYQAVVKMGLTVGSIQITELKP